MILELTDKNYDKYMKDVLSCLSDGFKTTNIQKEKFRWILHQKINNGDNILMWIEKDKCVSVLTLLLEHKFLHNGSIVGHIEDVATKIEYREKGFSSQLVKHACDLAAKRGCYKVILDTSIPGFYEKLGFFEAEKCMRLNLKK